MVNLIFTHFSIDCLAAAPSGGEMMIILWILLLLGGFVLWVWSLIHCITNKELSDTNRIIGVVLIIILGMLGSLIYLFIPRYRATGISGDPSLSPISPKMREFFDNHPEFIKAPEKMRSRAFHQWLNSSEHT